jgi:hypothetical protein
MATARIDHLLGKIIVYFCYLLTGAISIEAQSPYFALVVGTALWLFGINGAAYLVEAARGHAHRHNVL